MTIQQTMVGVHPAGFDVYDGYTWIAWYKTIDEARKAYPEASESSRYFQCGTNGGER
jgi:hypothetical protein